MFQAKCTGCDFPIEPGDKYLEAMGGTYHAECFTCSVSCQEMLDVVFSIKCKRFVDLNHSTYIGCLDQRLVNDAEENHC